MAQTMAWTISSADQQQAGWVFRKHVGFYVIMFAISYGDARSTEISHFSLTETVKLTNPLKPLTYTLKYGLLQSYSHS